MKPNLTNLKYLMQTLEDAINSELWNTAAMQADRIQQEADILFNECYSLAYSKKPGE